MRRDLEGHRVVRVKASLSAEPSDGDENPMASADHEKPILMPIKEHEIRFVFWMDGQPDRLVVKSQKELLQPIGTIGVIRHDNPQFLDMVKRPRSKSLWCSTESANPFCSTHGPPA